MVSQFNNQARQWHYVYIGIVIIIILAAMSYSFQLSNLMINKYAPLADAATEIKFEATTAHLWFEEKVSGDTSQDFNTIVDHLDQALWYVNAMLAGDTNQKGKYQPLTDPVIRTEVEKARRHLTLFKAITYKRNNSLLSSGVGSAIENEYDTLFRRFIIQLDNVETMLQNKINEDFLYYRFVQYVLLMLILVLGVVILFAQIRHDKQQRLSIVELEHAKENAEESKNLLTTTINSMKDGVIIADQHGNLRYMNPAASMLTGWMLKDAHDKKAADIFRLVEEYTNTPTVDPVTRTLRQEIGEDRLYPKELIARDGRVWPIVESAAPILDGEGSMRGVVVVFREITAQKKAEEEKKKLELQLRQASKMDAISTMAGGIAHDFNNILAIIIGNAELIRDDIPSKEGPKHNIGQILEAAGRARDLVKQVLSFSPQKNAIKEPKDLCRIVNECIVSLHSVIPSTIRFIVRYPDAFSTNQSCGLFIEADIGLIQQLLVNLCINSVQSMPETGELTISVQSASFTKHSLQANVLVPPGRYGHLTIGDTGHGIRKEFIDKIFDPFFTTRDVGQGTGMGLAVAHGIVDEHHGIIGVQSEVDSGTIFHIFFPLIEPDLTPAEEEDDTIPVGNERILVVDDEVMLAKIAKDMLERQGYRVTAVTNSVEAYAEICDDPDFFDLVLTDQTMPEMAGTELARKILELRPDMPIILCTGYSARVDTERAESMGITRFANKPLNRKKLARLVRSALDANSSALI